MADQTVVTGTAVQEIAELVRDAWPVRVLDVDDVPMTPEQLHDARPKLPTPEPLVIHTLTGLVDYVVANRDALAMADHLVHVVEPEAVNLVSRLTGTFLQRKRPVGVKVPDRKPFPFDTWMDLERINIALQAQFVDAHDRATVLQILGTVRADAGITTEDDGTTQNVTAKIGVLVKRDVPNPVTLAPFRTFPEVKQPASLFVLRLKTEGERVLAGLFEADGGAWKAQAIQNVAEYLRTNLPEELAVIA